MQFLLRLFVLSALFISTSANALIFELTTIAEALPYIRNESLVIMGVQGVLLETVQMLGSEEWAAYEMQRRIEKEGMSRSEALEQMTPVWHRILLSSPMRTVEPNTMSVIRQIQKRGNKILGAARHEVELAYLTLSQLRNLDIDMVRSAPTKKMAVLSTQPYSKYIDGILFVGTGGDAVAGAVKYISLLPEKPKHAVFLDTDSQRVTNAVTELEKLGIETQGLRLKVRDNKSSIYIPAVADLQLKYLGRMLPDQEARWLVDQGLGVQP